MNEKLAAALKYATEWGWPIFPAKADKTPLTINGVLDATTDRAKIERWWHLWPDANPALHAGEANLVVLDLDPGASVETLETRIGGKLPKTALQARTPRGGLHLFFALDPGEIVPPSQGHVAPHVDVRSFHSYVLLPPGETAAGVYRWESEGKPARRPDGLMAVLGTARKKSRERDDWLIEPDMPENIERCIRWLKGEIPVGGSFCKPAVEGAGGDHVTYATAAMCKSLGISEAKALDLMAEHYNARCEPPWDDEALRVKIENAYDYNTSPPGNCTSAYRTASIAKDFVPVETDIKGGGRQWEAGRFRFIDREGMQSIQAPEWLIPNLLPEGAYGLLIGAPGSFKTFLALDMALTIASGGLPSWVEGEWKGLWTPKLTGPVMLAASEGRPGIRRRVAAWESYHYQGQRVRDFVLADPVPSIQEAIEPFIEGALQASPNGYKLVILDTVGRALQGTDENKQEAASAFTRLVEALQRGLGCAVLAIHHVGHGAEGRERGSSVFGADADTKIIVRQEGHLKASVDILKQKDAETWRRPRHVEMLAVQVGLQETSLVAIESEDPGDSAIVSLAIVDNAAVLVLQSNPLSRWNDARLAEAMSVYRKEGDGEPLLALSAQQIRKKWLPILRESPETQAGKMYVPPSGARAGYWRFSS